MKLVIYDYPFDRSISFLKPLIPTGDDVVILNRFSTDSRILKTIQIADEVWMMGCGNNYGLLSRPSDNEPFDRFLIDFETVESLKTKKKLIGIWDGAARFARIYKLKGLFSKRLICTPDNYRYHIGIKPPFDQNILDEANALFVNSLNKFIHNDDLKYLPLQMEAEYYKIKKDNSIFEPLGHFNFFNW